MKHVAIIGSGPAGCYLADHLPKVMSDVAIDVLEQLPVPFGLIRYGVAPDHQNAKAVSRLFERILSRAGTNYFGNVQVGRDVSVEELLSLYDAVIFATGAPRDRRLGIPGEDLPGVAASGELVGWYNVHPDFILPPPHTLRSAVVIGVGNVAIDVARVLVKTEDELTGSDLPPEVSHWIAQQPLERIHIVGRRGAADAKFSNHELAGLGKLKRARPVVDPADLTVADNPVVKVLKSFAEAPLRETPITIDFHFHLSPVAFLGEEKLAAVQFKRPDGSLVEIPAQLAVTCIGYETIPCGTASPSNGVFENQEGRIAERLYAVGWAMRGATGTIATNRNEAQQLAQKLAREVGDASRPGGDALRSLLSQRGIKWVDYEGWRRIDQAEVARAAAGRVRAKFGNTDEMLEAAETTQPPPA